jgi:hypothetical protein
VQYAKWCIIVERKEHQVPVMSASGDSLEVLDAEGNPYKPDGPVKYQIIGEDGSTLKEGTLEDTNLIPLDGVTTKTFRVVLENHFVLDVKGFEEPEEEATEGPIEPGDEEDEPLPSGDLEEFEEYEGSFEDDAQYPETSEDSGEDSKQEPEGENDQSDDESKDSEESSDDNQDDTAADSDTNQSDEDSEEKDSDSDSDEKNDDEQTDDEGNSDDKT